MWQHVGSSVSDTLLERVFRPLTRWRLYVVGASPHPNLPQGIVIVIHWLVLHHGTIAAKKRGLGKISFKSKMCSLRILVKHTY